MNKEIEVGYKMLEVMLRKKIEQADKKLNLNDEQLNLFISIFSSLYMIQVLDIEDLLLKDLQKALDNPASNLKQLDESAE